MKLAAALTGLSLSACQAPNKIDSAPAENENAAASSAEHIGPCIHGRVTDVQLPNHSDALVELSFHCGLEEIAAIE